MNVSVLAGMVSTGLFAVSYLPMLLKALRTRNLDSYSLGYLALSNVANAVHSVYVFSLPLGPIWLLHCFYAAASALLLIWFLRFRSVHDPATAHASARRNHHEYHPSN
ncbi:hypothetical protein [Arthrobacter sp. ISL-65]|uniref:hypothetical protein n=1 Tax=Arthrobacter sp. ISL-65 TaxID=2819112 RepID=UPI001BEC52F7|nr:hypothetical protein [Arthrobacter sp. ISL-65]MBT2548138.1 hypothetical protein [Arthrobacter sp. ISL-65]